jgi:aldose 1-epimerase
VENSKGAKAIKISVTEFGKMPDGGGAELYVLENNSGMRVHITNYGATVTRVFVPDKNGEAADVVLGHKNFESYLENTGYFGSTVGRNSNRIAGGRFSIGTQAYELPINKGECNLHGGKAGLSGRIFSGEVRTVAGLPALLLNCSIADMEDGFPGNINVIVAYALTDDNALMIDYRALSDKDTVINLTNHSYFNLAGHNGGNILGHTLQMDADFYMPAAETRLPTGEILSVEGTPFDFRTAKMLGEAIREGHPQIRLAGGFDHNFVLGGGCVYRKVAAVTEPVSGRVMTVFTDLPGVQLFTSNSLSGEGEYKDGAVYRKHQALCLETQFFPNAVNMPWLASPIYRAGEEYITTTTYQFGVI